MEESGFFNSSDGERVDDATDFTAYFGGLVSNGVFYETPTNLLVSPGGGLAMSIAAGSVDLCVYLCKLYGFSEKSIICHREGYKQGIASNHADVMHWFPKHERV